ncbi:MAG: aminopeptidase, partial [Bacteroidota bacterium]
MLLKKYAALLLHYCLELKAGERLYLQTTTLAEPLVREIHREATKIGAIVEAQLEFAGQSRIFIDNLQNDFQYNYVSPLYQKAMEEFEAYLYIRAPFNLRERQNINKENAARRQQATKALRETYFRRTATRDLRRSLCQYPTQASAQEAGMSLEEYENFVFQACQLHTDDPMQAWLKVRQQQQGIVDHLNQCETIRYVGDGTDIAFSTKGRTWINSDGQTNMPSGEIYTSPVEDSVNGHIHFSFPAIHGGHEVEGVTLWVEDGEIKKWEAKRGQEYLDYIFQIQGTRRFGEAAIGNNFNIDTFTKNILFDEKIGGTVHMAIGQSYLQAGGKNTSAVHWDMI